jgi:hypothetical protein
MRFEDLLQEHRIPTAPTGHHHARSGWLQFDCPFCSPRSSRYRMGYNAQGRYVNCWSCGAHRLAETLAALTGLNIGECFRLVGGIDFEKHTKKVGVTGRLVLPSGVGPLKTPHLTYLASRCFDPNRLTQLWGIRGIAVHYRLAWRVFIPIQFRGETVSWTTRATSDRAVPRYISAKPDEESMSHKELLYGEDYVRHAVVVHEGPTDVWRTGPGAVATLGTSFTRAQVLKLSKYPVRAVCFDSDSDAQRRARELCRQLEVFDGRTFNVVLDAKDAGAASEREISRLRGKFLDSG